jgi:hypothetical protein
VDDLVITSALAQKETERKGLAWSFVEIEAASLIVQPLPGKDMEQSIFGDNLEEAFVSGTEKYSREVPKLT